MGLGLRGGGSVSDGEAKALKDLLRSRIDNVPGLRFDCDSRRLNLLDLSRSLPIEPENDLQADELDGLDQASRIVPKSPCGTPGAGAASSSSSSYSNDCNSLPPESR